jgi:hypothetical protein
MILRWLILMCYRNKNKPLIILQRQVNNFCVIFLYLVFVFRGAFKPSSSCTHTMKI